MKRGVLAEAMNGTKVSNRAENPPTTVRILDILTVNGFLMEAAKMQVCLHDLSKDKNKKETPFSWSENQKLASESVKKAIADAVLLAHPVSNTILSLVTESSDFRSERFCNRRWPEAFPIRNQTAYAVAETFFAG
ncbi:hypothetical protein AVEN_238392-1 [Araneus ventricosus]|uniref:Reverse transcriptase/retrotransposon-derived protein RNase H-like domain-containing protein n=1 Tax=Araneus ventricosus TaxID=182803 RepID=A0A4Y2DQV6_ARAVE|nr:hypothetical protein AVEN_238392-1 [Araneus ventricosus]